MRFPSREAKRGQVVGLANTGNIVEAPTSSPKRDSSDPTMDRQSISPALEEARQGAVVAERQRLAQVLHATVAQDLTAIYFTAKRMEMQLAGNPSETSSRIASLGEMIRRVSGELLVCMRALEAGALPPSGEEKLPAQGDSSSSTASDFDPEFRQPDGGSSSPKLKQT